MSQIPLLPYRVMHFHKALFSYLASVMLSSCMLLPFTEKTQSYHFAVYSVNVGSQCLQQILTQSSTCQQVAGQSRWRAAVVLSLSHLSPLSFSAATEKFFYSICFMDILGYSAITIMIHVFISSTLHDFSSIHPWSSQVALFLKQVLRKY